MATAAPPRAKAEARVVTLLPAATEIDALAHAEARSMLAQAEVWLLAGNAA